MTNEEKKLYIRCVAAERERYVMAHPEEMNALDILALGIRLLALKTVLKYKLRPSWSSQTRGNW